jgi:hypothetical protein
MVFNIPKNVSFLSIKLVVFLCLIRINKSFLVIYLCKINQGLRMTLKRRII